MTIILVCGMLAMILSGCVSENTSIDYEEYELWLGTRVDKSYAMIDQALEHGANINEFTYSRFAENDGTDATYYSPAWGAYKVGNFHITEYLLKKGADVNYPESTNGTTLAMKIAGNNHFKSLFNYGIDFYIQDEYGKRVIDHLVEDSARIDNNSQYQMVKEVAKDSFTAKTLNYVSNTGVHQMKDIYETLSDEEKKNVSIYLKQALLGNTEFLVSNKDSWIKECKNDVQAEKAIYAAFAFCGSEICEIDFEKYGSRQRFLLCAVTAGNWEIVDILLAEGVSKSYVEKYLSSAIQAGASEEVVVELEYRGFVINYAEIFYDIAETNLEWCTKILEEQDIISQTIIIDTARTLCIKENIENGIYLISQCEELSETDINDLLFYVNNKNGFDVLNFLENKGLSYIHTSGAQELFLNSIMNGSEDIALYLYDKGIVLSDENVLQAMKDAVLHGEVRVLEKLLESGVEPNNIVVCQAANSTPEILNLILEYGGDANAQAVDGWSPPLFYAVYRGFKDNVQILMAHGADPGSLTSDGEIIRESIDKIKKEQHFIHVQLEEIQTLLE